MTEPVIDEKSTANQKTRRGRKAGVPNRASAARERELAASGLTPLQFLTSVMRDDTRDIEIRIDAAKGVAPYVHPKLAQTQITGEFTVKHELKKEFLDKIASIIAGNAK